MAEGFFQRYEIKYMVDSRQRALLEQAFRDRMRPDAYGESRICNIYYDTADYRLVRASMEKPVYKEKLRLRSYGRARSEQTCFLELKKKYKGVVYKRRIALPEQEAEDFMAGRAPLARDSQIGREIDYFCRYYAPLRPAVYLCYDRCAYFGAEDAALRATFDKNICWREDELSLTARPGGEHLLLPGWSLFEVKTAGALPLWLVKLMDQAEMSKCSFSKYGEAYKRILAGEKGGISCA